MRDRAMERECLSPRIGLSRDRGSCYNLSESEGLVLLRIDGVSIDDGVGINDSVGSCSRFVDGVRRCG